MFPRPRLLLTLLFALLIVAGVPAWAQPAHSNAGGNGNVNAGGNGDGNAGGNGNGNAGGNGGEVPSTSDVGSGIDNGAKPEDAAGEIADHEFARMAVEQGDALPLAEVIQSATGISGEVIDARLVRLGRYLLYELKILDGRSVTTAYFYAKSGLPVLSR